MNKAIRNSLPFLLVWGLVASVVADQDQSRWAHQPLTRLDLTVEYLCVETGDSATVTVDLLTLI